MANWSQATSPETEPKNVSFCDLSTIPREELRVCIAEDNHINRKIAITFVNRIGLKCEAYEDGKQAYDALRAKSKEGKPFHLVLMDVQMPVLDGYEATKAIRADPDPNVNQVLVIAMTASAIRGDREKCLEAGMNDYLAKPVRQNVLKAMLDDYLSGSKGAANAATNGAKESSAPADKANDAAPPQLKTQASNEENSPKTLNGENTNGASSITSPISPVSTNDANGATSPKAEERPKPRRPFKRVMKRVDTDPESNGTKTPSGSPPSGKRETDELGKVSLDDVGHKPSSIPGFGLLNGQANGHTNGVVQSAGGSSQTAAMHDTAVNGHTADVSQS